MEIQILGTKLKHLRLILGSLKARAPPWWNPPTIQSFLSPRLQPTIEYPPGVELPSTCWRVLATYSCLLGGTSSLSGTHSIACFPLLSLALCCVLLPSSHGIYGLVIAPFYPQFMVLPGSPLSHHRPSARSLQPTLQPRCENPWLSFVDDHCNKDQKMFATDS